MLVLEALQSRGKVGLVGDEREIEEGRRYTRAERGREEKKRARRGRVYVPCVFARGSG